MSRAVFLDRDGVITRGLSLHQHVERVEDIVFALGAFVGLQPLQDLGLPLFIVTNQQDVLLALDIQDEVQRQLWSRGIPIRDRRICTHKYNDGCDCRKPKPGMILSLATAHHLDPRRCWMIGDSASDMLAAAASGAHGLWVGNGKPFPALIDAARFIVKELS